MLETYLVDRLCKPNQLSDNLRLADLLPNPLQLSVRLLLALLARDKRVGQDVLTGRYGQDVELVIKEERRGRGREREEESLVEPRLEERVRLGTVSRVNVLQKSAAQGEVRTSPSTTAKVEDEETYHRHVVELLQAAHRPEEKHDDSASLDRLDRPREQVGRDGLKVLQDEHSKRLSEHLVRVLVVCVPDVGDRDKELKGRLLVDLSDATLDIPLDLCLALLAVPVRKQSDRRKQSTSRKGRQKNERTR